MRYKAKTKDCHLIVRAKCSWGEEIDAKALDAFSRVYLRGFLKPKLVKKNVVEYSGPVGISLHERLKKPVSKRDFLFIMEQIVVAVQKIRSNDLPLNFVVMDVHHVYINSVTKELQFLFVPMVKEVATPTLVEFVESIVYSAEPAQEKDMEFVSRFIYFLKGQPGFKPDQVEKYIAKEDRSVVNTIKKQHVGQSGFMTSKQKHYYEHYDSDDGDSGDEATGLLEDDGDEATGLLEDDGDEATGLLADDGDEATGLLSSYEEESYGYEEEATGLLTTYGPGSYGDEEEATGLLNSYEEDTSYDYEEEATGLLNGGNDSSGYGWSDMPSQGEEEGTALLNESRAVRYPTLYRVLTEETISVNKPVFRLGKERSYVDYFVSNNNAVSRSHADIITRGNKYFVIDLNSKNHTYINNQLIAVQCETELCDGDMLKLGNEEFIFRV